ncbi:MAG: phosphatase PAP2 family protein [Roseibacillus sp.]
MNRRRLIALYGLPMIVFIGAITPFTLGNFDLEISNRLYNEKAHLWTFSENFPWNHIYRFAALPAIVTGTLALSVLALGFMRANFAPFRKLALFLILTLILGPSLLTGSLLGKIWERPQPYETIELGGTQQFGRIIVSSSSTEGRFHGGGLSSTGFYFFGAGLLLLVNRRRKWGAGIILTAGIYGIAIGIASMVQGACFAGDILLSAAASWFFSAMAMHALGLHRGILSSPREKVALPLPRWASLGILLSLLSVTGIVCLAFPASGLTTTPLLADTEGRLPDTVHLDLDLRGDLEITGGEDLLLETEFKGIGFPGSRLQTSSRSIEDGTHIVQRGNGHLSRLNVRNRLSLPPNRVYRITLGKQVLSVVALPPQSDRASGFFAHVWLTSGFKTKLLNIKGKAIDEDFFGRRTRSFRIE